eukprot:1656804-Rhodomonas_salina.1
MQEKALNNVSIRGQALTALKATRAIEAGRMRDTILEVIFLLGQQQALQLSEGRKGAPGRWAGR